MTTYAVLASNPGTEANATDHVVKPSPFIFAYCKQSKPEGLGTRLTWPWYINHLTVFCCSKCINEFDVALYQKGVVFLRALCSVQLMHYKGLEFFIVWQTETNCDFLIAMVTNSLPLLTLGQLIPNSDPGSVCVCIFVPPQLCIYLKKPALPNQITSKYSWKPYPEQWHLPARSLGDTLHLCGCHPLTTLLRLALWSSCVHLNFLQPKWPQELITMTNWMHSIRAQHCGASLSKTCATIAANEIYRHMHNIGTESTCWSRHTFPHGVIHAAHWSRIFNVFVVISC